MKRLLVSILGGALACTGPVYGQFPPEPDPVAGASIFEKPAPPSAFHVKPQRPIATVSANEIEPPPPLPVLAPPAPLTTAPNTSIPMGSASTLPPVVEHPILEQPWGPYAPPGGRVHSACNWDVGCAQCGHDMFSPDFSSYQVLAGAYYQSKIGPRIPDFNYIPVSFRWGKMLTSPQNTNTFWRGNWEALFDLTAASITSSYGSYFVGPSGLLRYNFVQPNATIIPYSQVGAGWVINDAYRDQTQRAIGQSFEFYLHVEVGIRCMLTQNLSLDIEGGLQHISNARLASRNLGVNALGVVMGFTYHFPSDFRW